MPRLVPLMLLVVVAWLVPGCAAPPQPQAPLTTMIEWTPEHATTSNEAVAASALVFAPAVAVAANQPLLDLDRTSRQRSAFLGYDEGSVETYRITIDDRQGYGSGWGWGGRGWGCGTSGCGWNDRYERQVYSERSGSFRR